MPRKLNGNKEADWGFLEGYRPDSGFGMRNIPEADKINNRGENVIGLRNSLEVIEGDYTKDNW